MAHFRFYRRRQIFPGVRVNLSASGPSLSFGVRGAHVTLGRRGVTRTVGIPGSGLYWTSSAGHHTGFHSGHVEGDVSRGAQGCAHVLGMMLVIAVAFGALGCCGLGIVGALVAAGGSAR